MSAERRLLLTTVLLLVTGACAPTEPIELSFAWPVDDPAEVIETIGSEDDYVRLSYLIRLEAQPGGGFVLHRDRLIVVDHKKPYQVSPQDLELWTIQEQLRRPPLRIDADGRPGDLHEPEVFAERLRDGLDPDQPKHADLLQSIALASHESTRPTFTAQAAQAWNCWVADWLDCRLAPGSRERCEAAVPVLWGSVQVPVDRGSGGYADRPEGHVRLVMSGSFTGEQIGNAALLQMFGGAAATDARIGIRREVVLDPATMRPVSASWQRGLSMGGEQEQHVTRHNYRFAWSGSD